MPVFRGSRAGGKAPWRLVGPVLGALITPPVCAAVAVLHCAAALADVEPIPPPTPLRAEIPAQSLARALDSLTLQTGLQHVFFAGVVGEQQTRGAPAGLAASTALSRLLQGTGFKSEYVNDRFVRIVAIAAPPEADPPLPTIAEVIVISHRIPNPTVAPASARERQILETANAQIEARIAQRHLLYGRASLDRYVQRVAERLLAAEGTDASGVHVRVIKGVHANAFALSNGSIYLTTGLLATLDDESQLAAVLGHELTHYTNFHPLRGLRQARRTALVAITAGIVLDLGLDLLASHNHVLPNTPPIRPETFEVWTRASISGYSRDLEREADDGGIRRMIAAGYDPAGALTALEHFAEQTPDAPTGEKPIYASHPRIQDRLASCRDLLAGQLAAAAGFGDRLHDEYRSQLAELPLDQVELLLADGALDRADRILEKEIAVADSGRAEFLRGESARARVPRTNVSVLAALTAYERAITLPGAPVSAWRQAGMLHRLRGDTAAATLAFQSYLDHAPSAVDAPLVRIYLDELRTPAPPSGANR